MILSDIHSDKPVIMASSSSAAQPDSLADALVFADEADFDEKRLWQRMLSASKYGDCLLTVATGELSEYGGQEEEKIGLVRTHAYAVLQVREVCGHRLLQLKNPWAKVRWKGAFSAGDTARWTPELKKALQYDQKGASQTDNGIFYIDYASLTRYFQVSIASDCDQMRGLRLPE